MRKAGKPQQEYFWPDSAPAAGRSCRRRSAVMRAKVRRWLRRRARRWTRRTAWRH